MALPGGGGYSNGANFRAVTLESLREAVSFAKDLSGREFAQPDYSGMPMEKHVIAVVEDLFFASKIRGTGAALGVVVSFARTPQAVIEIAQRNRPTLIVCDL